MTRFDPSLVVTRLIVQRNEHFVYDEIFHAGVNVVRGENSSGKSTILNCIYYGLGGDLADWSETALLCTRVIVEASFNGKVATLSREISTEHGQPMEIFGGSYDTSKIAGRSDWIRYPYRRSPSQESFSQALFRLLAIPEVATDATGNLTIHQLLRLLYSDQLSSVEALLRPEARWDTPALRDAVGRLLCGSFDGRLYQNEVQVRIKEREFDALNGQLRSLFAVLGKTEEHSLTLSWVDAERRSLQERQLKLQVEIEDSEREVFTRADSDKLTLRSQNDAYATVVKLQSELTRLRTDRDALALSIEDSALFIRGLEQKIAALSDAGAVAKHLGDVHFSFCPACFASVDEGAPLHACHLCKSPFEPGRGNERITSIINETAIQLKQSQMLQGDRERRLAKATAAISKAEIGWQSAATRLSSIQKLPSTEARERLRSLHREAGYLERELEDLSNKETLIKLIDELSGKKEVLSGEITKLDNEIDALRASQERQLARAKTEIADEVRTLLRNDLRRQDSFENPQNIQFDFASNSITVDGHTYFSASSRVILKSSFFIGFFAAATKDPTFRHPRFVMIDTIEDKGMEPERSHNFQNQILRISKAAKCEHQVIYATAMISSDLDDEEFLIGRFSTRDEPTLAIDTGARSSQPG
jgi:hypothetical protein